MLVASWGDPWLETRYGSPVAVAMRTGNFNLFQMLLSTEKDTFDVNNNQRDAQGRTIAHLAASLGRMEFLAWAIQEKQCNVNVRDNNGQTPLHALCNAGMAFLDRQEDEACLRLLVRSGADLHARDKEGKAPIHYAIQRETKIVLETLLQLGESPDALDATGRTPLHLLAAAGYTGPLVTDYICLLANAGANLNQIDHAGNAPIHYAIQNHVTILETLLNMGADPNVRSIQGQTALHLYCDAPWSLSLPPNKSSLSKRKKKHKKNNDDKAQSEIVTLLCSKGANVFCQDKQGNLPMFLAAQQGVLDSAVFTMLCQSASCGLFEANQRSKLRRDDLPQDSSKRRVKRRIA